MCSGGLVSFFSSGGLDTLVRDLVVEDRRKISSWLNEKGTDGKLQVFLVFNLFMRITGELKAFMESFKEIFPR